VRQSLTVSGLFVLTDLQDGWGDDIAQRVRTLTDREQQVAALVCESLSNKLIARKLNVSEGTIKAHLHAIYSKLSLESRFALIDELGARSLG
jgi:two-component system nitrate/nitrite response regulator NarL